MSRDCWWLELEACEFLVEDQAQSGQRSEQSRSRAAGEAFGITDVRSRLVELEHAARDPVI